MTQEKKENYLKFLLELYKDIIEGKSVTSINLYREKYKLSPHITKSLKEEKLVVKPNNGSYEWITKNIPSLDMAESLINKTLELGKASSSALFIKKGGYFKSEENAEKRQENCLLFLEDLHRKTTSVKLHRFSISELARSYKVNNGISRVLVERGVIANVGNNRQPHWEWNEEIKPTAELAEIVLKGLSTAYNEKYNVYSRRKGELPGIEEAILVLREAGYKIMKPVVTWEPLV